MTIRNDKEQIGFIEFKYKIAQRKFSDRVAWERLQQDAPLYNEDTIRTADGASATLFIDEARIELHESTMIKISFSKEKGVSLSVDSGDISIDTTTATKNLVIDFANGQSFVLESGSKVSAQAGQVNNLMVQSGVVSYDNGDGENVQIQTGETVKITEKGSVEKVPVSVTSVTENVHLLSFDNSPKNVLLQWNTNDSSQNVPVIVETSLSKDFSTIADTYKVTDGSSVNVQSPVGKLYWRVYLEDEKENFVDGKITVENVENVILLNPVLNQDFETKEESSSVSFSWKGNEQAAYYLFEVSASPDLSNPIVTQKINSTFSSIPDLGIGNYYWRVTPFYSTGNYGYGKSTEINSFSITKLKFEKPPVLSVPANNAKITMYDSGTDLTFIWKGFSSNVKYQLLVSSDSNFKNVIYSDDSSNSRLSKQFSSDVLKNGTYYWKVVSTDLVGDEGKKLESEVRSFITEKYIPGENKLIYPPNNFSIEESDIKNITFQWKISDDNKDSIVNSYLQISSNKDFNNLVVNKKTSDSWISGINTINGNFWWRVALEKNDGSMMYTQPGLLHVLKKLSTPELIYPISESVVVLEKENTISIKWKAIEGVESYSVKVFDGEKIINNLSVKDTQTKISFAESNITSESKRIRLMLQGFTSESENSASRESPVLESTFKIRKPVSTVISRPENGTSINGLVALRNPVEFSWINSPDAENVTFELKKMQPTGSMQVIKTKNNPGSSYSVSGLSSGTYEWTVKALSKNGYNLDAEKSFSFTILPIPELVGARLVNPTPNQIIGADYLITNKSVNFKWKSVPNATDYRFILYQRLENGKLKRIVSKDTKNTEYKITDLTSLDIGDFEWQIIAYIHGNDGREEQKSRASVGKFSIYFEVPTEVEVISPDIMYGE